MSFNPELLSKKPVSKQSKTEQQQKPRRIFMQVDGYEKFDNFTYAVGVEAGGDGRQIKVRLNTVSERCADVPSSNPDTIKNLYVSGSKTRPSLMDKSKDGIKLLSFDGAVSLGNDTYRAHWGNTCSVDANARVYTGLAHLHLESGLDAQGNQARTQQAYIEAVKGAVVLSAGESATQSLLKYLDNKDENGIPVKPSVQARIRHDGNVIARGRMFAAVDSVPKFDEGLGKEVHYHVAVSSSETLSRLMSGALNNESKISQQNRDLFRAIIEGCDGTQASYESADAEWYKNISAGIKSGQVTVELVAFERLECGAGTRKSLINNIDKAPNAYYTRAKEENGHVKKTSLFTPSVVVCQQYEDGSNYVVSVTPLSGHSFKDIAKMSVDQINAHKFESGLGLKNNVVAELVAEATADARYDYAADEDDELQPAY